MSNQNKKDKLGFVLMFLFIWMVVAIPAFTVLSINKVVPWGHTVVTYIIFIILMILTITYFKEED